MSNKLVIIGEHEYPLPSLPEERSEILFVDEKPENAYWQRITDYRDIWYRFIPHFTKLYQQATLYDQDENLISLNKDDSDYILRIYEQEMRRRRQGVWFKNFNEFVYLTGNHYFLLQWCKMMRPDGKDYPDYREFQRDYFYLLDLCWKQDHVLGLFVSKPKKTGITNIHWSGYYLNKATMTKGRNLAAMNLDERICAKMFRDHFMYSFNGLPPAFKPLIKSKAEGEGNITFGRLHSNSKRGRLITASDDEELNTSVFAVPTKPKACDVARMDDVWIDEPPKIRGIGEIFRTNKQSVKLQSLMVGRMWFTSYTPEESNDAFKEAREIYLNSEKKTISPSSDNQTKSGMICWHIPAFRAWEGCFNKHGKCNEKEAIRRNQAERDKVKHDPRELLAVTRQYANDKKEAWATGAAGSTFDPHRIADLLADLEIEQAHSPDNDYIEGNYVWTNPLWEIPGRRPKGHFCPVKFVPLTEEQLERGERGKIRSYHSIPSILQNQVLQNGRDEWGNLLPPKQFSFFGGGDPTNYAAASEVIEGSKNAYLTINLQDESLDSRLGKVASKIIFSEYYDRPELPDEACEDLIKEIIYTGKLNIVEANAPYIATRIMEEGLGYFMIVKDENGILTTWKRHMGLPNEPDKTYQLIRTTGNAASKDMLETLVRLIKNYLQKPGAGYKDYGKTIKSIRLLTQIADFDSEDTRLYDLVMALGYTLLCYETYMALLLQAEDDFYSANNIAGVLSALRK